VIQSLTVVPGRADTARLEDRPTPDADPGLLEIETLAVGLCGTDAEIVAGKYGAPPAGAERLVLGHEAVGRIVHAWHPEFPEGQLVVPIVRRPDPVPCSACAAGEWDMCENGRFLEHGIKGADGFAQSSFTLDPTFAVAVPDTLGHLGVLVEPTSIVAKAWEQIERIGARAHWNPRIVLITGAGPVGLLAALLARQRHLDVHVLDRVVEGPKPHLVDTLGASYHTGSVHDLPRPDIVIECTGAGSVVLDAIEHTGRSGIVCLAGISSGARTIDLDAAALNRRLVLENDVVFGTVNANRRHYLAAVDALTAADPAWLTQLVTRRVPAQQWHEALLKTPDDVKVLLEFSRDDPRPHRLDSTTDRSKNKRAASHRSAAS
jgi:threonine dehydrogenase-like Zn-dependent dehydrogenase